MPLEFRGKEEFLKEIEHHIIINHSTLIEAILDYQHKYDLDAEYIATNLMTASLYDRIRKEAESFNLIKKEETDSIDGI